MEVKSNTNGKKNIKSVSSRRPNGLKASMQQLDAIFKASSDIIFLKDVEGRYAQVNSAGAAAFGLDEDNIIGKTDFDIFPVDIAQRITQDIDLRVFEKGETVHVEDTRPVGGKMLTFDVIKVPVRDTAGKVIGLCGIARDITERKRAEEELNEQRKCLEELSKKRTKELEKAGRHLGNETVRYMEMMQGIDTNNESFRAIVENANHFIMRIRLNPVFKFEYVSPQVTDITGYTPEDFYADSFINLKRLHPDDLQVFKNVQRVFYTPVTLRWIHKDGSTIWCEEVSTPFYDKSGNVIGIQVIAHDVTEQKKSDSALRESRELYQVLLDSISDAMMLFYLKANTMPGKLIEVNEAACRLLGYGKDELLRTDVLKLFAKGDEEWSSMSPVYKTLQNRQRAVFDSALMHRNGDQLPVEVSAYLFEFRNKLAVLAVAHDLSDHLNKRKRIQINGFDRP
jgi:PAS domain S-box-containing protein